MNKSELVERVASSAGVSRGDAEGVLDTFFETVRSSTKSGDTVGWPGFGKFTMSSRAARTGRNPQTGEAVKIKASKAMKFSASSVLKDFLNTKGSPKKAPAKAKASSGSDGRGAARATASAKARGAKASASKSSASKASASKASANKASATKAGATRATATKATAGRASGTTKKASGRAAAAKAPAKKATAGRAR